MSPTLLFVFSIFILNQILITRANPYQNPYLRAKREAVTSMNGDESENDESYYSSQQSDSDTSMSDSRGSVEYYLDKLKKMPKSKLSNITKNFSRIIQYGVESNTEIPDNILSIVPPSVETALEKILNNPESMVSSVEDHFLQMMHAPGLIDGDAPKIKSGFKNAFKTPDLSLGDISAIQEGVLEILNVPDDEIPSVLVSVAKNLLQKSQSGDSTVSMAPPLPPITLEGLPPVPSFGMLPLPPLGEPLVQLSGLARKLLTSIQIMESNLRSPVQIMK